MLKMIIFDMAGTTVDEGNVVYKTLHKSVNEAGYEVDLPQVLAVGAGKGKFQAIKDLLILTRQNGSCNQAKRIFQNFQVSLENAYQNLDVREQPGASWVFNTLQTQGIKVVLNTGYNRETAEQLVDKIGWKKGIDFDELITDSDVCKGRPHPCMIELAMKRFGITEAQYVAKIGDSTVDIEEGKNAGCGLTFGITTGAQTKDQLKDAQPDYIVNSLEEMMQIVVTACA